MTSVRALSLPSRFFTSRRARVYKTTGARCVRKVCCNKKKKKKTKRKKWSVRWNYSAGTRTSCERVIASFPRFFFFHFAWLLSQRSFVTLRYVSESIWNSARIVALFVPFRANLTSILCSAMAVLSFPDKYVQFWMSPGRLRDNTTIYFMASGCSLAGL